MTTTSPVTPAEHPSTDYYSPSIQNIYQSIAAVGHMLANPIRLRLLETLEVSEMTVEDASRNSGIPLKNTSAQLQLLRGAGLLTSRREGVRVFYRLASPAVSDLLRNLSGFAEGNLGTVREAVTEHFRHTPYLHPLTADALQQALASADPPLVIDVRSEEKYARGHIPGAVSIPLPDLVARLGEIPIDRQIVAYCDGPYCLSSPEAAHLLAEAGYTVANINKGITSWIRTGLPLEQSTETP